MATLIKLLMIMLLCAPCFADTIRDESAVLGYIKNNYLKLDATNDPITGNLEVGSAVTDNSAITVFSLDNGNPTSGGIFALDAQNGRGSWINPSGQDGVSVNLNGTLAGVNSTLYFNYYSAGDVDICSGGGDIRANAANFTTTGIVTANAVTANTIQGIHKSADGTTGFSGTGAYTNFTIKDGIVTAAS